MMGKKKMMKGGGKTKKYMAGGGKTKKMMAGGGKVSMSQVNAMLKSKGMKAVKA